ncbi:MAG: hypothetical protein RBR15_00585 [Sphaerochaeta sp.]|nr:hypothetical protein [Sphaerochaeta sp.]
MWIGIERQVITNLAQDGVTSFVIAFLEKHGIAYEQIEDYGIFSLDHLDEPVVKCSLAEVANLDDMNLLYHLEWDHFPLSFGSNGAMDTDNGFGVVMQLKLLQKYPNLNFVAIS